MARPRSGKTPRTTDTSEHEIQTLLEKIDGLEVLEGKSKAAKLSDVEGEMFNLEANLVGMRRALIQHRKPNVRIDQQGTTLASGISDSVKQLERLRAYKKEIQALPDDPEDEEMEDENDGGNNAERENEND